MSEPFNPLPRKALIAIGALIGFTLLLVVGARLSGYNPRQAPDSPAVASRDIRFVEEPSGAMIVSDLSNGTRIGELAPGNEGFVRGVLRFFGRDRHARHIPPETPYRISRLADGRMTMTDLATQRVLELNSFGPTNLGPFVAFLNASSQVAAPDARPAQVGQTGKNL